MTTTILFTVAIVVWVLWGFYLVMNAKGYRVIQRCGHSEDTDLPLAYMACPYTDDDEKVREERFLQALFMTGSLLSCDEFKGAAVCPVIYGHTLQELFSLRNPGKLDKPHNWWMEQCMPLLEKCDVMYVLKLDGWDRSRGVYLEVRRAKQLGIPVYGIDINIDKSDDSAVVTCCEFDLDYRHKDNR